MNVLVFGGTGYVGEEIVNSLIKNNYNPILFTRKHPKNLNPLIKYVVGEIDNLDMLRDQLNELKIDYIIYCIGFLREKSKGDYLNGHYVWVNKAISLGKELGVKKFTLMSANGVKQKGTAYQSSKYLGERALIESGLTYSIFRPSVICGKSSKYHFANILLQLARLPITPVIGNGSFLMAPVDRTQVADIFTLSLNNSDTNNQIFTIAGPTNYSFKELILITADHLNKKTKLVSIPVYFIRLASLLFGWLSFFPLTPDMLKMLLEGNTSEDKRIWNILKIKPTDFKEIIKQY